MFYTAPFLLQCMKYKIIKLDRRYTHRDNYSHLIEFYKGRFGTGVLDYDRACRWFAANFGWSQEVEVQVEMRVNRQHHPLAYADQDYNDSWCYCSKYDTYRIYVKSAKELEWFLLANPNDT